jgi:hypothetical protein
MSQDGIKPSGEGATVHADKRATIAMPGTRQPWQRWSFWRGDDLWWKARLRLLTRMFAFPEPVSHLPRLPRLAVHALILLLFAVPVSAQPGVVNGVLVDPAAYVGSLIDFGTMVPRAELPSELARIKPALNACGLHLQNEDRGDYRARLFPSATNFDRYVDFYDWDASQRWVWIDHLGGWTPMPCALGKPADPAPVPTPGPIGPTSGTPPPPLVINTEAIVAAIDRNTDELKSIHADAKSAAGAAFTFVAKYLLPPIAAAVATWQVAK